MKKHWTVGLGIAAIAGTLALSSLRAADEPAGKPADPAVERARKTVKLLDDVYKTTVVYITSTYVNDEDDVAAGTAAIALLAAVEKQGHPKTRLIDVTGEPYDEKNTAKDDFEKRAVAAIRDGKTYVDEVETKDGKRYLRAATSVPVVLDKCIMCHAHYEAAKKKGEAIGALVYTVPVE